MAKDLEWTTPEKRNRLTRKQKADIFIDQNGRCPKCTQRLHIKGHELVDVDKDGNRIDPDGEPVAAVIDEHVKPLWAGGSNNLVNRQLWCVKCASQKTATEATDRSKERAKRDQYIKVMPESRNPIQGGRKTKYKRCMDGTVIDRRTGEVVGGRGFHG